MNKVVFMETAFLLAVIDTSDKYHAEAAECYRKLVGRKWQVVTC
jgi:predicted nucleic acid-binding protein